MREADSSSPSRAQPGSSGDQVIAGADGATLPSSVIHSLVKHPLTEWAPEQVMSDRAKTGQSIL
jgi:hypothetical protein